LKNSLPFLISVRALSLLQPVASIAKAITSPATVRLRENERSRCTNMLEPLLWSFLSLAGRGCPARRRNSVEFGAAKQHPIFARALLQDPAHPGFPVFRLVLAGPASVASRAARPGAGNNRALDKLAVRGGSF
jgi:hypothetical protein